jgi:acylphosphatase
MAEPETVKVIVKGRVQGVYYRAFTKKIADSLNLTGFVKNLRNGNVEALVQGDKIKLDQLLARLRRGPEAAVVDSVTIECLKSDVQYREFVIIDDI